MRKLYLHIGIEKTGTTSIQQFLDQNRVVLSDNGYHVLECGGKKNQRAIPSYCMLESEFDDFFLDRKIDTKEKKEEFRKGLYEALNKEMASLDGSIHSVIVTSEHFHSRLREISAVKKFKELIDGHFSDIEIICYIREQSALALSSYSTSIKSGSFVDFESYLRKCSPDNTYYNFEKLLDRWSTVFSSDSLNVRIFSKDEFFNNNLIDDFCVAIDQSLLSCTNREVSVANESFSNIGLMIVRVINAQVGRYDNNGFVNKNRKKAVERISESFKGNENNITFEQYNNIQALFKKSNEAVNKKYFNYRDNLFMYAPPLESGSPVKEEQVNALSEVIESLTGKTLVSDQEINLYRDAALLLENIDIHKAYELMQLAQNKRPNGPLINRKMEDYKKRL